MPRPRASIVAVAAAAAACGGRGEFRARPVLLVARDTKVEASIAVARQNTLDGEYDRAEQALRRVLEQHRGDPMVPVARLLLARVAIARGEVRGALEIARRTDTSRDPSLGLTRRMLLGVGAVLDHRAAEALVLLRPIEGRLTDRAETAELACGLAEAEAEAGDTARALRALAVVETITHDGGAWVPTGLQCERPDTRLALLERLLARAERPQLLADALDALPAESPLRRSIAIRLRALADSLRETARWLRWLGDLPDETATRAPIVAASGPRALIIGVLAPLSGTGTNVGLALVRGVQFALEGVQNVRPAVDDEGTSPSAAVAAFDRLVAQGARAVVGVARAEDSAAIAIRAQAVGVDVWLVSPARGVEGAGARAHVAGPPIESRVAELATAARARTMRVTVLSPDGGSDFGDSVSLALEGSGVSVARRGFDGFGRRRVARDERFVVAGAFGREARVAFARAAERAPASWIFDARSALPGGAGTWVGVRAGAALTELLPLYCRRVGEPPGELELLGYDAARRAVAFARSAPAPPGTLAVGWPYVVAEVSAPTANAALDTPAAASRCPAAVAPIDGGVPDEDLPASDEHVESDASAADASSD